MSTRIYNAYLTTRGLSETIDCIKAFAEELRETWRNEVRQVIKFSGHDPDFLFEWIEGHCTAILSGMAVGSPEASVMVYGWPAEMSLPTFPLFSQKSGLEVTPERNDLVVVQLFGTPRDLEKTFLKQIKARDFHYQNQADKPRNISKMKWKLRERAWDLILGDDGVPEGKGLYFDLVSKKSALAIIFTELCLAYTPLHLRDTEEGKKWEDSSQPYWCGVHYAETVIRAWSKGYKREVRAFLNVLRQTKLPSLSPGDQSLLSSEL